MSGLKSGPISETTAGANLETTAGANSEITAEQRSAGAPRLSLLGYGNGTNFEEQEGRVPPVFLPVTVESLPVKMKFTGPGPKVRSVWMRSEEHTSGPS